MDVHRYRVDSTVSIDATTQSTRIDIEHAVNEIEIVVTNSVAIHVVLTVLDRYDRVRMYQKSFRENARELRVCVVDACGMHQDFPSRAAKSLKNLHIYERKYI